MYRFLVNILIFIILIIIITFGLIILSDFLIKRAEPVLLNLENNIHIVFSGDSNVECSVNDEIISNSVNVASSGEAYLYSYVKIKALLEHNKQINQVFIGYSPNNLSKFTEERWLFKNEFIIEKVKIYNYLLNFTEKEILLKNRPEAYSKGLFQSVLSNFNGFLKSILDVGLNARIYNFGGYQSLSRNIFQNEMDPQKDRLNEYEKGLQKEIGPLQEKYLKKISNLCRQNKIKLILLNTPKFQYDKPSEAYEPEEYFKSMNYLPSDYILDLSQFILPDSCFADLTHLNYKGAKVFSEYLNDFINQNKGQLEQTGSN